MWKKIDLHDFWNFKSHIKNTNNINKAGLSSASILFLIALFAILPFVPHMDGAEAAKDFVPATTSITVETGKDTASLTLVPNVESGVFATSSDDDLAKFSVTTNSATGYTLSVVSGDDDGWLSSTDLANENKLNTIDTAISEDNFKASGRTELNGRWGFKPNKHNGEVNTEYLPAPTTAGVVLDITDKENTVANDYTIALGARANTSLQYGTYAHTFSLAAVANPALYNITFEDTSGDYTVANMPDSISGSSDETYVTLPSTVPTRDNYVFKKWCSAEPADGACPASAEQYSASEEFYLDQTSKNIKTLYAIWGLETYSLTITFAGEGVESVQVRTAAGTEGELIGTVTNSGDVVENLEAGQTYYLYPSFSLLHKFQDWSANNIAISDTTSENPVIDGSIDGSVIITGRNMTMQEFGNLGADLPYTVNAMGTGVNYTLLDSRDDESYIVSKLTDGNVWMRDNLRLGSDSAIELTSADTNITSSWTLPASGTVCFSDSSCTATDGTTTDAA